MKSKSELSVLVRQGRAIEVFTHSTAGEFDISAMRLIASFTYERFTADLTADLVSKIKQTRDWDAERVKALTIEQAIDPTLWIDDASSEPHLLIDGTHRLIASFERFKLIKFRGYMANLTNAIRPDHNRFISKPEHEWGRMEVRKDGLYDRTTGKKIP